jgi:hypothetical protein
MTLGFFLAFLTIVNWVFLSQYWADFSKFDGFRKQVLPASTWCHWFCGRNFLKLKTFLLKKKESVTLGF